MTDLTPLERSLSLCLVLLVLFSTYHRGEVGTGCDGSAVIFPACFLTLEMYKTCMEGRLAPKHSLFLSCLVVDPDCDGCTENII